MCKNCAQSTQGLELRRKVMRNTALLCSSDFLVMTETKSCSSHELRITLLGELFHQNALRCCWWAKILSHSMEGLFINNFVLEVGKIKQVIQL